MAEVLPVLRAFAHQGQTEVGGSWQSGRQSKSMRVEYVIQEYSKSL